MKGKDNQKLELEQTKRNPQIDDDLLIEDWQDTLSELEREEELTMVEIEQREKKRAQKIAEKKRKKRRVKYTICFFIVVGCAVLGFAAYYFMYENGPRVAEVAQETVEEWTEETEAEAESEETSAEGRLRIWEAPEITYDFITPNRYSRPGDPLLNVDNIFVHYTANPGTSAAQTRSYFNNQAVTHERSVSAHFVIGTDGEIIQCLPLDEVAYAVQRHNYNSLSIECCYFSEDGQFTKDTYDSLIQLLGWLVSKYDLKVDAIQRHSDTCYKKCPKYYAEHDDKWNRLKLDVEKYIKENGSTSIPEGILGE